MCAVIFGCPDITSKFSRYARRRSFPLPVWASLFVALFFPLSPPHRAVLYSPRTVSVRAVYFLGEIDSQEVVAFVFGPETVSPAGCLRRCFVLRAFVAFLSTSNAEAERPRHGCTVEHTDPPFFVPVNIFFEA